MTPDASDAPAWVPASGVKVKMAGCGSAGAGAGAALSIRRSVVRVTS